jgi:hypothetical protein
MTDMNNLPDPPEDEPLPISPKFLCPFLAVRFDTETYSAISDRPNYCHKAGPIAPVSIEHQVHVCTTEEYESCPVFFSPEKINLPRAWVNQDAVMVVKKATWQRMQRRLLAYLGISLVFLLVVGYIYRGWISELFNPADQALAQNNPTTTLTLTLTPAPSLSLTSTRAPTHIHTYTPDAAATQTQEAFWQAQTATAASLLTPSLAATSAESTPSPSPNPNAGDCEVDWANALTVQIQDPTFWPKVSDPPAQIVYGSQAFLVKWRVTNTSSTCTWNFLQLMTTIANEPRLLTLMTANRDQPLIDQEFALRDDRNYLLNQLNPGQSATIVLQIDGMSLFRSQGMFDKTCELIVNGHLLPAGKLIASPNMWVIVVVSTPTFTPEPVLPTRAPTVAIPTPAPTDAIPTPAPTDAIPTPAPTDAIPPR